MKNKEPKSESLLIRKTRTYVQGLDQITGGGLPTGRPTLVCGGAGTGKTMLAAEFVVHGAIQGNEPGVFMMFEESAAELSINVRSLGFDLDKLIAQKKIVLDYVHIERSEIEETGEFDLEGLFIRLDHAINSIGAKRVVLDTIEALFSGLPNHALVRAELRRLFRWLKLRGMTAIITCEQGDQTLTRFGLEEYVADCVIVLDHRVSEQISTRRMRVLKYRGSAHGTNEYPFLIGAHGLSILPITSLLLDHKASNSRISSGVARLDEMLGGKGVYRATSVLVSGAPGTGKSSIGAAFADAACSRGERCLLFVYEESPSQVLRNMRSIGIKLEKWVTNGLLKIHAARPTLQGLEQHLVDMHELVIAFRPSVVVVDPISNLTLTRNDIEAKPMLMLLIDFLKRQQITTLFTSLTSSKGGGMQEDSQVAVSSLMDTWLLLKNVEYNGERNRTIQVLKSRGIAHSNQIREFVLTNRGIELVDVYPGADRVLTGTARVAQEVQEQAAAKLRRDDHDRRLRQLDGRRRALGTQVAALRAEADAEEAEVNFAISQENLEADAAARNLKVMRKLRGMRTDGRSRK